MSRKGDKLPKPDSLDIAKKPQNRAGRRSRGVSLTDRQLDVVRLIAEGKTDNQIGEELGISPLTASTHVKHILKKLGVPRRAGVFSAALRGNLLTVRRR